jgi:hypothetical protein
VSIFWTGIGDNSVPFVISASTDSMMMYLMLLSQGSVYLL